MKAIPMIFNTEMVHALLDGRKGQTRRPFTSANIRLFEYAFMAGECSPFISSGELHEFDTDYILQFSPAKIGDLIWVRERMRVHAINGQIGVGIIAAGVKYVADGDQSEIISWPERLKEKPVLGKCLSNGGPREFSRTTLKVTGVRVERVQDISDADAIAEGFKLPPVEGQGFAIGARTNFRHAWMQIYGDHWKDNGWCWVIDFDVIFKNVDTVISELEAA